MNLDHSIFYKSDLTQETFAVIFRYTVTAGEIAVAENIMKSLF